MTPRPTTSDGLNMLAQLRAAPAEPAAPARTSPPKTIPMESAMDFNWMLDQLGEEVERRMGDGQEIDAAYASAIPEVLKRLVEGRKTEAFEDRIIETLRSLSRGSGRPVPSTRLATELGQSTWATWYYLTRLETRGLVYRPGGKKSGWLAR